MRWNESRMFGFFSLAENQKKGNKARKREFATFGAFFLLFPFPQYLPIC